MSKLSILPLLSAATLVASLACGQQSTVRVEEGQEEGQARVVIENTLNGIGRMISASSDSGDVQVQYDRDGAAYHIRGADGSTVDIDARTGKYTIRASRPDAADATVENSLAAVGSMLSAISQARLDTARGLGNVLTPSQRDALRAVWHLQGLSQEQIDSYVEILQNADEIERYARQLERNARVLERQVKDEARGIERDARQLERQVEGDARRIERDVQPTERDARRIEREARQIQRQAEEVTESVSGGAAEQALYSCGGGEELVLRGRQLESDGVVVYAYGSCDVLIEGCEIRSGSVAIRLEGNADAKIYDSHIEGRTAAVEAGGNAEVKASDTVFVGELITRGNAEVKDRGGNTFRDK